MGSGFSKMKKQARQMQEQYQKMREEMQHKTVTGSSEGGLVSITLNGEKKLTKIEIKPECVDPNDIEGLQDLILSAYENASKQLEDTPQDMNSFMPF